MKTVEDLQPFAEILQDAGVETNCLTGREAESLDREGYVIFDGMIDASWLVRLRDLFDKIHSQNQNAGTVKESGTRHVDNLLSGGKDVERVYTHKRLLAAVYHILKAPFRVAQMNGRDPLSGYGQQGLHADWTARLKGEPFRIVTSIWLLDDFTAKNGATRLVPGSHLLSQVPKSFADPARHHPNEKIIVAQAGSVLVFNGHTWHSGTRNQTNLHRRALQLSFVRRDELRFSRTHTESSSELSEFARYLLDLDEPETEGQLNG